MMRFTAAPYALLLSIACTSTQLPVPADHPARPDAAVAPLPVIPSLSAASIHSVGGEHAAESGPGHADHAPAANVKYTCPMHPEVVRDAPGNCPHCGMKLVPKQASQ
ncbi:MAG TPA: heavy metal-binding domain-containing protein [Polyangiaceae bacterium]|nr:heavy metal-binding domain-containing protein [Polyangiaceae bacterium]